MPSQISAARAAGVLAALLLGVVPASAEASARRWAAPGGLAGGPCSQLAPCSLKQAIEGAAADDEVIVKPGDHLVNQAITAPVALTVHGEVGQPRPRVLGDSAPKPAVLTARNGGTIRHLSIEAANGDALRLEGTLGEDLLLSATATGDDAAEVLGSPGVTVLRDTLAISRSSSSTAAGVRLSDSGKRSAGDDAALRNVTAYATGGVGIRCATVDGASTLVNVIARGRADIDEPSGANCTSTYSAFRWSSGNTISSSNTSADPLFVNSATGDFRLTSGSALIDAGTSDLLGTTDPDGNARTIGSAPDIGAYEHVPDQAPVPTPTPTPTPTPSPTPTPAAPAEPSPTPTPTAPPEPAPQPSPTPTSPAPVSSPASDPAPNDASPRTDTPAPRLGSAVVIGPAKGTVSFRAPGSSRFIALDGSKPVPTGSVIDTRRGTVTLQSALNTKGATQTGSFRGGVFRVRQSRRDRGMTDLILSGTELDSCPKARTSAKLATTSRKRRARPKRRLWASDKGGRFRTRGANSIATARGTAWLTEDRCDGTLTRVTEGSVEVRTASGRRVIVRAGHQRLIKPRSSRKR